MEPPNRPPRKIDTPAPPSRISQNTTVSKVRMQFLIYNNNSTYLHIINSLGIVQLICFVYIYYIVKKYVHAAFYTKNNSWNFLAFVDRSSFYFKYLLELRGIFGHLKKI